MADLAVTNGNDTRAFGSGRALVLPASELDQHQESPFFLGDLRVRLVASPTPHLQRRGLKLRAFVSSDAAWAVSPASSPAQLGCLPGLVLGSGDIEHFSK